VGDHNYCRNPDDGEKAWCYTTDPQAEWEYCNVPTCNKVTHPTLPASVESYPPTRIQLVTNGRSNWFVEFNASLQVTITRVKNGQSSLMGTIPHRKRGTIYNWRKSGLDLVISVNDINTSVNPAHAVVEITFGKEI